MGQYSDDSLADRPAQHLSRRRFIALLPPIAMAPAYLPIIRRRKHLAVDLFTSIGKTHVRAGTEQIFTRGWGEPGVGAGLYVFDPVVDEAYVSRFPRSSALSANGLGYRLAVGGEVSKFGALGDGHTDDTSAINEALSQGGEVVLRGPAVYFCAGRILLAAPRTRLRLEASVIVRTRAWRYAGSQFPFGNAIHITGTDCEVLGSGSTSVIECTHSDANGIGFFHCGGGRVAQLTLRGGKNTISAIADDTFQSGISIINNRGSNPSGRSSATIVQDCVITGWMQYGFNIYGDLAKDIVLRRNAVIGNGLAEDQYSVGAGIALTRGVGLVTVQNNTISQNKGCGIFVSSAGAEIHDLTIIDNTISANGRDGVCCTEERQFGAIGAIGQERVRVSGNRIESNGGAGVRAGTYDGVGSIRDLVIEQNKIRSNRGSGVILQANTAGDRGVDALVQANELAANGEFGLTLGPNRIEIRQSRNVYADNRRGATIDYRGVAPRRVP